MLIQDLLHFWNYIILGSGVRSEALRDHLCFEIGDAPLAASHLCGIVLQGSLVSLQQLTLVHGLVEVLYDLLPGLILNHNITEARESLWTWFAIWHRLAQSVLLDLNLAVELALLGAQVMCFDF